MAELTIDFGALENYCFPFMTFTRLLFQEGQKKKQKFFLNLSLKNAINIFQHKRIDHWGQLFQDA